MDDEQLKAVVDAIYAKAESENERLTAHEWGVITSYSIKWLSANVDFDDETVIAMLVKAIIALQARLLMLEIKDANA